MRLVAFVCANGLGHYRRVVGILSRVQVALPDLAIDIACEQWQKDAMQNWPRSRQFWQQNTRLFDKIMDPGVQWVTSARGYDDGRLVNWFERASQVPKWEQAGLVLSDNLAAPLSRRADTILSGSFLWSDVLEAAYPDSSEIETFVATERELLRAHTPHMLCVDQMAMPGVFDRTRAVGVAWMCEDPQPITTQATIRGRIAVLGSATGSADTFLVPIVHALAVGTGWSTAVPKRMLQKHQELTGLERVVPFDFSPDGYAACDLIIARPGMGTVTDCVSQGVPILALHEPGNSEMAHIGQQIEKLGIGRYLGANVPATSVVEAVQRMMAPVQLQTFRHNIASQSRNGLQQAADWLTERLTNSREKVNYVHQ